MSIIYADRIAPYLHRQKDPLSWAEMSHISLSYLKDKAKRNEGYINWLNAQEDTAKNHAKLYNAELEKEHLECLSRVVALMESEIIHLHRCLSQSVGDLTQCAQDLHSARMDLITFKQLYESEYKAGQVISNIAIKNLPEQPNDTIKKTIRKDRNHWEKINTLFKGNLNI